MPEPQISRAPADASVALPPPTVPAPQISTHGAGGEFGKESFAQPSQEQPLEVKEGESPLLANQQKLDEAKKSTPFAQQLTDWVNEGEKRIKDATWSPSKAGTVLDTAMDAAAWTKDEIADGLKEIHDMITNPEFANIAKDHPAIARVMQVMAKLGGTERKVAQKSQPPVGETQTGRHPAVGVFARILAKLEGFGRDKNNLPTRANNPLDVTDNPYGYPVVRSADGSRITHFPTVDEGWEVGMEKIEDILSGQSTRYKLSMTLEQFGKVYARDPQYGRKIAIELRHQFKEPVHTNMTIGQVRDMIQRKTTVASAEKGTPMASLRGSSGAALPERQITSQDLNPPRQRDLLNEGPEAEPEPAKQKVPAGESEYEV